MINLGIGEIKIDNKFATGSVLFKEQETPLFFHFYNEHDGWKIDIHQMTRWGEAGMIQQVEKSGMTENEFIFYLVQAVSGNPVNKNTIFKPLVK